MSYMHRHCSTYDQNFLKKISIYSAIKMPLKFHFDILLYISWRNSVLIILQQKSYCAWFEVSAAKWLRTALFWVITQRVVVISCRRFVTACRSHPQGSGIQKKACSPNTERIYGRAWAVKSLSITGATGFVLGSWTVRMGPIGCPETSVRNCHYSVRNNSEERIFFF